MLKLQWSMHAKGDSWQFRTQAPLPLSWHTTSRPLQWPREAAVTKNKEAERPRIASAWEEGVNYCPDKPRFLHMQLDYDVAGACKLVPAVWPWSMLLWTGDRVQLCRLIIYSCNTASLETSGSHCIYLHSWWHSCLALCRNVCVCFTQKTMP